MFCVPTRKPAPARLTRRLPLLVVAITTAAILVIAVVAGALLTHVLTAGVDNDLRQALSRVEQGLPLVDPHHSAAAPPPHGHAPQGKEHGHHEAPGSLERIGTLAGAIHIIRTPEATQAGRLSPQLSVQPLSTAQTTALLRASADHPRSILVPGLGKYRALATTKETTRIIVALPLEGRDAMVTSFATTGAGLYAVVAVLAWGFSRWRTRRALAPLAEVTRTAREVSDLDLTTRAEVPKRVDTTIANSDTEAGEVARALNIALDNIESALVERQATETSLQRFVADASHELRTPVATISGYAQLLSRLNLDPQAHQAAERIRAESARMGNLVADLLLLARLDAGARLVLEPVALTDIVVETVADAGIRSPDHPLSLDIASDVADATVVADADRVRQILTNLLTNACQHTPAGTEVAVRCYRGTHDGAAAVLIDVADAGDGIPAELVDTLFERFTRADSARSRSKSTGLGLAIAHTLATAMGGGLQVKSSTAGATFTLALALPDS